MRYVDDILILKEIPKGVQNVLRVAEDYLEGKPKLAVNRQKTPVNLVKVIRDLNLRGFMNYFRVANCKTELRKLMSWLRTQVL